MTTGPGASAADRRTATPLAAPPLDVPHLVHTLHAAGVRYLVIGAIAIDAHGATLTTFDFDVCYDTSQANTRALARALQDLNAIPCDVDGRPVASPVNPRALQFGDDFLFVTDAGRFDCLRVPDGTAGFDDLIRTADEVDFNGTPVFVSSLEDLIRMKRATNRPKDRIALEVLGALRDEIAGDSRAPTSPVDSEAPVIDDESMIPPAAPAPAASNAGGLTLVHEYVRADGRVVHAHYRRFSRRSRPEPVS